VPKILDLHKVIIGIKFSVGSMFSYLLLRYHENV